MFWGHRKRQHMMCHVTTYLKKITVKLFYVLRFDLIKFL